MEKTTAFVTSDNQVFRTREEAQRHELDLIFNAPGPGESPGETVMAHKDAIRAILADRKPRTPKAPKATAKRKPRLVAVPDGKPTTSAGL